MSNTWVPFPDAADTALRKAARLHGETILGSSGTGIAKATGGALSRMPAWMMAGHLRAAAGGNARDIARVASVRDPSGYFGKAADLLEETARVERLPPGPFRAALERTVEKRADQLAAHQDRPTREHALSAAAHRTLAAEHEEAAYRERHAGNHAGEHAHEHAALAHHHAARLASDHDSDFPLASYQAREATRSANARCERQVSLATHKAAGGDGFSRPAGRTYGSDTPFGSQGVREEHFREPRSNPHAFRTSGGVGAPGLDRREGYEYPADAPAHGMAFLADPRNDPRASWLNWPAADRGAPGRERSEGIAYPSSQPAKAAGYDPNLPLTALAKRYTASHYPAPLAKSLDSALAHKHALGESCWHDFVAMVDRRHELLKGADGASRWSQWQRSDVHRSLVSRIERAPLDPSVRAGLLAAIA